MRARVAKLAFNRGLVSRLGLARADIKRLAMAAEVQTNWIPRVLGSMMLRPGWALKGSTKDHLKAKYLPFVFSTSDKALVEVTALAVRVFVNDALITRPAVSTVTTNGNFDDPTLFGWTDSDESGAASAWVTGGYLGLTGTGSAAAIRDQTVTVAVADRNVEHALNIVIERGPVILRVGSSSGGDEYVSETELATGYHSLGFTPTGDFYIRMMSRLKRQVLVDSCSISPVGIMSITAPWAEADLGKIRYDQSGDVLFIACDGYQQHKIERRATRSWSVVRYYSNDGPFRTENVGPITMTAGALSGNTTLTASAPYFKSTNVGSLFSVSSDGQAVEATITADNQFTSAILVEGVDAGRVFSLTVDEDAAGAATFTLQRSLTSDEGPWTDVLGGITADLTQPYDDSLDNQIAWYRFGVKTGDYVNGTHIVALNYPVGSLRGICRVTAYTSPTVVQVEVIEDFGGIAATATWAEGSWSQRRGYPTSVVFHEGRLTWAGRDAVQLSESDDFEGFNHETEGDSGPINRTIGSGPVDNINWALSLQRLILGAQGAEFSVRASSLDEPLTPTNFNIKAASTQGSAAVPAVKVDQNGIFVQRGGTRVFEMAFGQNGIDYESVHLSALVPEIGEPGIVAIAVQRQPDTRIHFVRSDGTVAILVFDRTEQVICWLEIETDGVIEDAVVLPGDAGDEEDWVYYCVKRTISGGTERRYIEKWAFESEARGGTLNKQADSFITYTQAASSTIANLTHLAGKSVIVWDNGVCLADANGDIATFTVSASGTISVTHEGAAYLATNGVVGLPYSAPWKSAKLVELMESIGGSLNDSAQLKALALVLADVHAKGLKYGHNLTEADMRDLPVIVEGQSVDGDAVRTDYASEKLAFPGRWSSDSRLCLLAKAPRPVTVMAAIAELEHHG